VAASSSLIRRALKATAAAADRVRTAPDGVVILLYHRVGGESSLEIDLDAARFEEQMAVVAGRGVIPLGTALDQLAAPVAPVAPTGTPLVVVTFDDGTADFVDVALPILVRHRVPATLYLATDMVEGGASTPEGARPISWAGLRDACATGLVDVGSHTHSHRLLDRTPPDVVADELDRSIDLIGEHLGRAAADFAYPKAVAGSADAARLVQERFRSAALAGTRVNPYRNGNGSRATDRYRLARSPIQVSDGMQYFERKLAGGMALEDTVRRTLNRVRYAKART
jgi:peptidoglycan/xylan/chitin deacetylase (PgdA/CDA1 family)